MKRRPADHGVEPRVEPLEARIAPATLDLVGGVLKYTAAAGVANSV